MTLRRFVFRMLFLYNPANTGCSTHHPANIASLQQTTRTGRDSMICLGNFVDP